MTKHSGRIPSAGRPPTLALLLSLALLNSARAEDKPAAPAVVAKAEPCDAAATAPGPSSKDGGARAALAKWEELYARCPTPAVLGRLAGALEEVGRDENSIVHVERAIHAWQKYDAEQPSLDAASRVALDEKIAALRGVIEGSRARRLVTEARAAAARAEFDEAVRLCDEYFKAAPRAPDRAQIEKEREEYVKARRNDDWDRRQKRTRTAGYSLLGIGAALFAAGAVLVPIAVVTEQSALKAERVTLFEAQEKTANTELLVGGALLGAGAAVAVAGITAVLLGRREAPGRTAFIAPAIAPGSGGIVAGGTF